MTMAKVAGLSIILLAALTETRAEAAGLFGQETAKLTVSGLFTDIGSDLQIDFEEDGTNSTIDPEDDLGFGSSEFTFRIDASIRLWKRHRLFVGYYRLSRSGERVLAGDVEWRDSVYPTGATIEASGSWRIMPLSYAYSFVHTENWEVAASLGVHWIRVRASIAGDAFLAGRSTVSFEEQTSRVDGPFPLIGFHVNHKLSDRWEIGASGQWLNLSIGNLDGEMYDIRLFIEYYIFENVGVGVSFNRLDFSLDVDDENWIGSIDYAHTGVMGYLVGRF